MHEFDRNKSLEQIEGKDWGQPTYESHLVTECHRLRRLPLCQFTVENLRIMIGQSIGLPFLVPLALDRLRRQSLAKGDYYRGDLLAAVLRADRQFWREHAELQREIQQIATDTLDRLRGSSHKKRDRFRITLEALDEAYGIFSKAETTAV